MQDQTIIVCDDRGNPTGEYIPKEEGHTGEGKRHLAICVLLKNSKEEILLQKRKHKIFDNIWDVTGATNNLHLPEKDEDFYDAAKRCLKEEYNLENIPVKKIGSFNYFAQYGNLCENEHCAIMVGEYNGDVSVNSEDAYEIKWIDKKDFLKDIEKNPSKYTPWCIEAVKKLKQVFA